MSERIFRRKGGTAGHTTPPDLDVSADTKTANSSSTDTNSSSWFSWIFVNILMLLVGFCISTYLPRQHNASFMSVKPALDGRPDQLLGMKGALLFKSLDADGNGKLGPHEFGPIVEKLTGEVPPVLVHQRSDGQTGDVVTLFTEFHPLVFESMKTFEDEGVDGMMRNFNALSGLRSWTSSAQTDVSFYSRDFYNFLPKSGDEGPGKGYWLFKPHIEPWHHGNSAKYFPPNPDVGEETLYRLMRMFHARPFLFTRFGPQGSAAVVQAYNNQYYNIKFRIHCEFQVNEPPRLPFWVTPAQFTGNLVIRKDGLSVKYLSLNLPANRSLNVDMEWLTAIANEETGEAEQMEVEIGYQPKMAIHMTNGADMESFQWTKSITEQEALSILKKTFYPFEKVEYLPFGESFDRAAAESKLVHTIVLWGSLDDQSC